MSYASMSLTNRRQIWPNQSQQQHPLRRHKSLFIDSQTIGTATPSTAAAANLSTLSNSFASAKHTVNGVNLFRTTSNLFHNSYNSSNNKSNNNIINNSNNNNNSSSSNKSHSKNAIYPNKSASLKKQTSVDQIINRSNNNNNSYLSTNSNNTQISNFTTQSHFALDTSDKSFSNRSENFCTQSQLNYKQFKSNNSTVNIYSKAYNNNSTVNNTEYNDDESKIPNASQYLLSNTKINCSSTDSQSSGDQENDGSSQISVLTSASEYYAKRKQQLHHTLTKQSIRNYGDFRKEKNSSFEKNRIKKHNKNSSDDKVNLNIFLSQNISSTSDLDLDDDQHNSDDDEDSDSSDDDNNSSASNKTVKSIDLQKSLNAEVSPVPQIVQQKTEILVESQRAAATTNKKPLTASARRALFRASKNSNILNFSVNVSPPGYKDSTSVAANLQIKSQASINKINFNANSIQKSAPLFVNKRPPSGAIRVPSATITTARSRISSAKKSLSTLRVQSANRISSVRTATQPSPNSHTNANEISAAPSLIVERRPPLIRAMSAPIRSFDENSKNILANKRKPPRRRKPLARTPTENANGSDSKLIETADCDDENEENFEFARQRNRKTTAKNTLTRSRSTIGIDVVTLVSLISSEESDSEKEEISTPISGSPVKRAPPLRKSGKSVSFQDNQGPNTTREYCHMLRRGSIAPLAAKLRSNRPPTAPPVSIFMTDIEQGVTKMDEKSKSCSKEDLLAIQSSDETKENACTNKNSDDDSQQYPEFVKSLKERECWKLFQRMTQKGVSVSYETVLRGLLTPTEMRQLLAKRKEIEMAQLRQQEIENAAREDELKKNLKNKSQQN